MSSKARRRVVALILVALILTMGLAAAVSADEWVSPGPAPNSGDGIPDGSGLDGPCYKGIGDDPVGPGPAPNAGDGIPDGSGF